MGSNTIKKTAPFVISSRNVEGGIYNKINTELTGGIEIGNYHLDNYAGLDTAVLQSPITDMWNGGHSHRHVPINTGNDNASNRPEAWHIEFDNTANPSDPTITFHSYNYLNSPPAFFTREEYVKRPLNVKNIRQNSVGNFKHNYEVVQTSGRRITNNLIVDGFVAGGELTTQFITGSHNYSLPVLNSVTGSKSVIVERFNAPGSKEESSRGALDREGEEMSPNISLPWRNYKVRQPFYSQLSQSTPQFGASIHGVHRNTLPASGSRNEETDNGFISRPIPRTDIQYSWITASSTTTAGELGGYQAIAFGESDIEFISGSELVVDNTKYIIDNLGISSLIKDKKQVDLDTKTISYSSDIGLSASFGELTHSPYSFTTWNSIRTGEHPISKALRKNNIISVQAKLKPEEIKTAKLPYDGVEYNRFIKTKRSSTSLNFSEPAVTFKYRPLKTKVRLAGAPEGSEQIIVHTFTNNIGNFANEDLRIETGLEEKERSEQFYDFLRSAYTNAGTAGNPIAEYLGYQYNEIVWPREENTGLSRTRGREAYILDQPGFDRDGYDRQLGTQRVFWRDNQEDRKRSKNSEGGYYSSMNYLSTEESGSDFTQARESIIFENKFITFSSSFVQDLEIDNGLFNSIRIIDSSSLERGLFYFSSSIFDDYAKADFTTIITQYANINKRSYVFDISGEFNNSFIDFYEQRKDIKDENKKSIGSLYRSTSYKSLLTALPKPYTSYEDFSILTEDDQIVINPKLKFISFIGGAELNTSDFIQNEANFTNEYLDNTTFSYDYFSQSFNKDKFVFSTIDNGLLRVVEQDSDKKPFYDSYEKFVKDIRAKVKEYSVIPEFRISEHMEYYVVEKSKNFRAENKSFLSIDGIGEKFSSATNRTGSIDENFFKIYTTSDFLKRSNSLREEDSTFSELKSVKINISGIKKLLPYNGFYPQDRTIQIGNIYSDYVDNNLHGGVYNLSYYNDYYFDIAIDSNLTTSEIGFLDTISYNNKNYLAVGDYTRNSNSGSIIIYTSSVDEPTVWSNSSVATIQKSPPFDSLFFGACLRIISASNGLNLFTHSYERFTFETGIYHCTSSDGIVWSEPELLEVYGSSPSVYITGSASDQIYHTKFDLIYDVVEKEEKIVIVLGSPNSNNDSIHTLTGSLVSGSWRWSDKTAHFSNNPSPNSQYYGSSLSIISCSSGYQAFFNTLSDEDYTIIENCIYMMTSSTGNNWSTPIYIGGGSKDDPNTVRLLNLKAIDYKDRTYVFFSEPNADIGGYTNNGGLFVISSSINNYWGTSDFISEKTLLYKNNFNGDVFGTETYTYVYGINNISLFSGSDGRLYYCAGNPYDVTGGGGVDQIILGNTKDGQTWQTSENDKIFYVTQQQRGAATSMAVVPYFINEFKLPIFFANLKDSLSRNDIYAIKNNIFTNYSLRLEEADKFYKHAALEPFFAPGILYNTIKSGISVDWPCATGSNTAIIPYGGDTIVNAYYPKTFEINSFSGSNIYESAYGILRSNIDYRIPFENLLFPNEAFKEKDYNTTDLISRTVLTTLPDSDPVVQFISETYIYGGYEPYISPIDFSDINNFGPKRFSVPFVYRKAGSQDSGLYTLAMSNFLAETVKFFLKDEKMTTFVSDPDYKWKEFNSNKTYYMDIVLEKSPDLVMMEAYHSELHPTGSNGEKMNGRYFGYPINKTDKAIWGEEDFTAEEKRLIHNDPAYAPYTPPYFEGVARARISFKPQVSGKYTLQEVFDNATVENIFVDIAKGATTGSDAYVNAMPINSSIDIFGAAQAVEVTIDETTGEQTVRELQNAQNWIISPRMETPVLDFSSQQLTPYENNYSKTGGFGRGMWSGYGSVPTEGKGIKVRLEDPFSTKPSPNTGSLLNQVGLRPEERNVGSIADSKLISEAIVVIPYLDQTTRSKEYSTARKNKTDFEFIKISKKLFNKQLDNYRKGKPAISPGDISSITLEEAVQDTSITEMIEKMEKYVIPPEMNFLEYADIDPFVMYIFEFEHVLDQQDLVDIWQGLMPKISYTAEEDSVSISHNSAPYEFFEGKEMPENLRWMVFKVKRKAEYNYFNVTATTKDDTRFNFNKIIGRKEGTDVYSYNWPYDFFSLVEFAKVELTLDYKKKEE